MSEYAMKPWVSSATIASKPEHADLQWSAGRKPSVADVQIPFGEDTLSISDAPSMCRQSTVASFYDALKTWKAARGSGGMAEGFRPPYKQKQFYKAQWNYTGIRVEDGRLRLSNGRDPIWIDWPHEAVPVAIEIGWDGEQYEMRAKYKGEEAAKLCRTGEPLGSKVAGLDIGEIYLATVSDGEHTLCMSGRQLKSLRSLQNSEKEFFASRIDRKKKGSRRWWKMVRAKNKRLGKINRRIEDMLHKITTRIVEEVYRWGCCEIVIGDLSGIRDGMQYGKKMNQRLHQWAFKKLLDKIKYKAERYGIAVTVVDEAYTSQTCPSCGHRHKPKNRGKKCPACGMQYHRDAAGALNIRAKYQDPASFEEGFLEAVRATATEPDGSKGTRSSGKTLSLFDNAAVMTAYDPNRRGAPPSVMLALCSPTVVAYDDHLDCVVSAQG